MGSFHSSASSGSSTLDMMGRVVREGNSKEERRGRSKHQVKTSNILSPFYPYPSYPTPSPLFIQLKTIFLLFRVLTLESQRDPFRVWAPKEREGRRRRRRGRGGPTLLLTWTPRLRALGQLVWGEKEGEQEAEEEEGEHWSLWWWGTRGGGAAPRRTSSATSTPPPSPRCPRWDFLYIGESNILIRSKINLLCQVLPSEDESIYSINSTLDRWHHIILDDNNNNWYYLHVCDYVWNISNVKGILTMTASTWRWWTTDGISTGVQNEKHSKCQKEKYDIRKYYLILTCFHKS